MSDPFKLLGIEMKFDLNPQEIEKLYFEAQRKTHPDRVPESEKVKAQKLSVEVNQAYLTLKDPLKRAEALIKVEGYTPFHEDIHFLPMVMEWNLRLEKKEDLRDELTQVYNNLMSDLTQAFEDADYEKARQLIFRLTYVQKILKEARNAAPNT